MFMPKEGHSSKRESIKQHDSMQEGRGGVGKHAASLELTAGKEQRNHVSQCSAEVHCVTTALHYRGKNGLGLISADWKRMSKG